MLILEPQLQLAFPLLTMHYMRVGGVGGHGGHGGAVGQYKHAFLKWPAGGKVLLQLVQNSTEQIVPYL